MDGHAQLQLIAGRHRLSCPSNVRLKRQHTGLNAVTAEGMMLRYVRGLPLRIQGFIVSDQWQRYGEFRAIAAPLVKSGQLRYREDIVEGLDNAPEAFIGLLQGKNFGKLLIHLSPDQTR